MVCFTSTSGAPKRGGSPRAALGAAPELVASPWKGWGQDASRKRNGNASGGVGVASSVSVSVPKRGQKAGTAASALFFPWDTKFEALLCKSCEAGGVTPWETFQPASREERASLGVTAWG